MSILLKWKNKIQDPSLNETKIREFDERVLHLKNENVELHKRIDQLEALCKTSVDTQQTRFLEEHIRQLEQENGRLFAENQCQRQEYERFLDQLTNMVLRTAVMQENIRQECASIYHVIERISSVAPNTIPDKRSHLIERRSKRLRSLSWENLTQHQEFLSNFHFLSNSPQTTTELIRHLYQNRSSLSSSSSSSCSSATTHCSFSTSGSWTLDLAFYDKNTTVRSPILPISNEPSESSPVGKQEESEQVLQRSETFIICKIPQEESPSASSSTANKKSMTASERPVNSNVQRCSTTRALTASTSVGTRPSRLPSRCSTTRPTNSTNASTPKISPSNNNSNNNDNHNTNHHRSLSVKKASKLPIRTPIPSTKPITPTKKSTVPTPVATKTKKDSTITSIRAVTSANNTPAKKTIRPPTLVKSTVASTSASKFRSRSITTENNQSSSYSSAVNKRTRTTPPVVKKTTPETTTMTTTTTAAVVKKSEEKSICTMEKMNSTSSESSIEENQRVNKLLTVIQDEGYSTWSSSDVKDEIQSNSLKKNPTDERRRNTGLVENWLDTSKQRCSRKPVKEVELAKLEEFSRELSDGSTIHCPFVRNRCSNGIIIPLASTTLTSVPLPTLPDKDLSMDSLDGADSPQPHEQTLSPSSSSSSSSSAFSPSETFEKLLIRTSLPNDIDDLADSTDSTCSDLNQMFHISEYVEDNFIGQDEDCSEHLSNFHSTRMKTIRTTRPRKRLMFPGLINHLIYLRRVLSDSDLRQKVCCIGENEIESQVYHSNIIHEHSVEVNLMNTYGSDSELHVWSRDCAEQRRFTHERQQQQQQQQLLIDTNQSQAKLSHFERMIRMTLDDNEDDVNAFQFNHDEYDQQLALERQTLLQQIYEYPWLLQDDDLDRTTVYSSPNSEQALLSPSPDLVVPSHNPDFYQLCALTNSSSFATSYGTNSRHTTPPIASSVL